MPLRNVIGIGRCKNCSADVELRINSGRKVYYFCDGMADDKACQDFHRWNERVSKRAIAESARDGWLGPVPYQYFPPTKAEGNIYAAASVDAEAKRAAAPYEPKRSEGGPAPAEPRPAEPIAEPEAEPVPEPRAEPKRRRII